MENLECLKIDSVDQVAVVKFIDPKVMDPSRIEKMGAELLSLLESDDNEDVVVNFENVSFFSSAAINKLIVLERHVRARGGEIRLSNLRPEVRDLFSYTHLDELFQIREDQADAIESLAK
jgi:anti-anti-sigma factor